MPADQPVKLAIIVHDVYRSVDLAFRLLLAADEAGGGNHAARFADAHKPN